MTKATSRSVCMWIKGSEEYDFITVISGNMATGLHDIGGDTGSSYPDPQIQEGSMHWVGIVSPSPMTYLFQQDHSS